MEAYNAIHPVAFPSMSRSHQPPVQNPCSWRVNVQSPSRRNRRCAKAPCSRSSHKIHTRSKHPDANGGESQDRLTRCRGLTLWLANMMRITRGTALIPAAHVRRQDVRLETGMHSREAIRISFIRVGQEHATDMMQSARANSSVTVNVNIRRNK